MRLTFLGATGTVTGSKYLLESAGKKILIDCGLFQGIKQLRLRNWRQLPISPKNIDAVILTHAHIDHSGYLPLLVKNGFAGQIYCTKATKALCDILLPDSGYLQEEGARLANKYRYSKHSPALPLYTMGDATYALKYFHPLEYESKHTLANNFSFSLHDVGHIFGAAYIKIKAKEKTLIFSGDLGRFNDPIINPPHFPRDADYLIVESTYGNRLHEPQDPTIPMGKIIAETLKQKGVVIIPAFAVGRTQLILYYLYKLKQTNQIPNIPIYVDSPMATDVSMLFRDFFTKHRLSKKITHEICSIATYVQNREESKKLDLTNHPKIIISASGMATGGRVLHHLKRFLPHKQNAILFTGYQAVGTRGDRLLKGEEAVKIHGEYIPVKARIEIINNLSAHADYAEILNWVKQIRTPPKTIFITHGEQKARQALQRKMLKKFGCHCVLPKYLQTFTL